MRELAAVRSDPTLGARREVGADPRSRGQVLVLFAVFLVTFLGAAGLAVDYGVWLSARRNYQAVTDSAVLAGTTFLSNPGASACAAYTPQRCAREAAWRNLNTQLNLGLTDGQIVANGVANVGPSGTPVGPYTIWVDTPPNAAGSAYPGSVGGLVSAVFARVEAVQPTYFSRIFGFTGFNVNAWATADLFPSRFAVITLRRGQNGNQIDSGPANTNDIKLAGSGTTLKVVDGDIGGNFGMKLTAGTLTMVQPSAVYLIDYQSCGNSCWSTGDLVDENGVPLSTYYPPSGAKKLPRFVPDPMYVAPPGLDSNAPNGPLSDIPLGDGAKATPGTPTAGVVDINAGSINGATCAAGSPRIGPGTYTSIRVRSDKCLILDPTYRHSTPNSMSSDVATPVGQTQRPGIFYVTGDVQVDQGALIVGDGVTMIIRPKTTGTGQFSPNSRGVVDLNTGKGISSPTAQILGAWTTKGASPYVWGDDRWQYQSSQETNKKVYGRGVALYVLKPSQYGSTAVDTDVIQVTSLAGLSWAGVTYAPHDNVQIAGQPNHQGIGQLVSWTFTFNGGADITQTYDGPNEAIPYLVEPCVSSNGGQC